MYSQQYLLAVLSQDIIELPHQMVIDCLSGADVLEFHEHVKSSRCRAQCLKRLINEADGLSLNSLSTHMKNELA